MKKNEINDQHKLNEVDLALCRSAIYEALAMGFRFPTAETLLRLATEEQILALAELAFMLDVNSQFRTGFNLASRVRHLTQCSGTKDLETLRTSYQHLFGHTARSGVPLYETEYGEQTLFQQPQQLGDIHGFFNAFGLKLNTYQHERVDHISCECEFLCFLARKEAYSIEQNDSSMLGETRKAQRLFLKEHLARFAPSFSKLLNRADPDGFYGALGNLCYDFILSECEHYKVQAGSELLSLSSPVLADECFACGAGEEVLQIAEPSDSSFHNKDEL